MNPTEGDTDMIRVVLADANVLYSRVLRDYLLYAADEEIIAVAWSPQILAEVTEHLQEKVPDFDAAAASRLVSAMNRAFPFARSSRARRTSANWPDCSFRMRTTVTCLQQRSPQKRTCCVPPTSGTSRSRS